ncbi:ABC transporter permease [Methylophaga pinxianii]|uniref:ABC transporter permease n=1 Tax=Methylophaga pinxianii TaxID=2881052 RepID=UPI001CF326F4|nr:ABC transporter permease [Methylophaga pinxianii]MCB2426097.1 ABC transporter permease [Methylophaga pinxianii]UPH46780.1 ABC transporter permease [Methylophaga pinxianii]
MWCVARLEISRLFLSPFAWAILALVQFLLAYLFLSHIEYFAQIQGQISAIPGAPGVTEMVIAPLLNNAALVLLLIAPFITMRAFADEHRNHSLPLLISAPLSATQIVLGKYIGYLVFFLLQLTLIVLMPLSLMAGSAIDFYQLGASMFGLILLVASFVAAGVFLSSLTTQPVIAAVMTFCLLFLLWVIDFAASSNLSGQINWLGWLSLLGHFQPMLEGQINSVDLSFFALFCFVFLLMTMRRLDAVRLSR